MIKEFSSLHGHSHFSIGDGLSTPEENVKAAKEKGLKSIALTDHGVNHGHAELFLSGKKHGVRVVFGVEAYVIHDLKEWNELRAKLELEKKEKGKELEARIELTPAIVGETNSKRLRKKGHLVLLARNRNGLSNINQLVYKSHRDGFYGKPRMDKLMLREHSEGIIATTACMGGVLSNKMWELKKGDVTWADVVHEAREFDDIFGRGHFFLELQYNEMDESQNYINECMVRLSQETGIPLTTTTDFHYSKQEEWEAREILHMLDWDKTVAQQPNGKIETEIKQLFVKSPEEMWLTYQKYGARVVPEMTAIEAFKNTLLIDSLIEDYEPDTAQRLPSIPYENPFKEMGLRAIAGLKRLGLADKEEYKKQLLHELTVIKEKGMANYFVILQEIIDEAKKTMLVGAGRGSAAASLVCYSLGITDLDPVKHGLMFERFMDPHRKELADIDVDFEDVDAAKDMLRKMYGNDNVACLSTYNTFSTKGLLKDLGRVYGIDHNVINMMNKKIDMELKALYVNQDKSTIVIKLDDIVRVSPTFNKFVAENPDLGRHFKTLYGRNSHIGRHASGVIIGDDLKSETAIFTSKGVVQTSFTEGIVNKNLSAMGMVKFDILSIATLKTIHYALKLISQRTGQPIEELRESIRPHNMDLNDMKVLKHVFWDGNFCQVFQFTERGIRKLAQRVRPDCFDDVSAVTSLYRPGPLSSGMHKMYVENKQKALSGDLEYDHPILEKILKKTHGTMIYQEQLMQFCQLMGKMDFKDVQRVRKTLLKKDKSKSEEFLKNENVELKGKFIKGCLENGMTDDWAETWWKNILGWGSYGFNIAHSYTYSVMTMQCAHLATYHPLEFYAAALTKAQSAELQDLVSDIQKVGIKVLPVDINKSKLAHTIEMTEKGEALRLSFASVLGVGPAAIEKMVAGQPYSDFPDFLRRSGVGKTPIGPLIQVGAFDPIYENLKDLETKYNLYCQNPKWKTKKMEHEWQAAWAKEPCADYGLQEKVFFENTLMGFSLQGHPFEILDRDRKIKMLFEDKIVSYKEFIEEGAFDEDGKSWGMLPVVVKEYKERAQRNGQMMAWVKFGVETGEEFEAPAFSSVWKWISPKIKKGSVYVVIFNRKEDDPSSLIVGKPGFGHSPQAAAQYVIDIDEIVI